MHKGSSSSIKKTKPKNYDNISDFSSLWDA